MMKNAVFCLSLMAATAAYAAPLDFGSGLSLPYQELTRIGAVSVRHGGFGSAAFADPTHTQRFYALTDRGPNADATTKNHKIFVTPDFTPSIGHFEITPQSQIRTLRIIPLKRPDGTPLTGLPNPSNMGATGESAVDIAGQVLPEDAYGLDSEGLVVMKDGSFWVSDEYGPHIVHFSRDGIEQERISPYGLDTEGRKLPAVLAKRTPNRGMEGLAISPDQKTLVGIMQSTLNNPDKARATNRTLTRIVTFDLDSGKSRQYLYQQNRDNLSNSEIVAVDKHRFLVVERDSDFAQTGKTAQKHIYLIDVRQATDVSAPVDAPEGMTINGQTLEQMSWETLASHGIKPVQKTQILDLVQANGYPHDKLEGMWLMGKNRLAVINDDDFAIASENGQVVQKTLPATGQVDANTVYIYPITLPKP